MPATDRELVIQHCPRCDAPSDIPPDPSAPAAGRETWVGRRSRVSGPSTATPSPTRPSIPP